MRDDAIGACALPHIQPFQFLSTIPFHRSTPPFHSTVPFRRINLRRPYRKLLTKQAGTIQNEQPQLTGNDFNNLHQNLR